MQTATLTQAEPQTQLPPEFRSWPEYLYDEALRRAGAADWNLTPDQEERFDQAVDALVMDAGSNARWALDMAFGTVIGYAAAKAGMPQSKIKWMGSERT